MLGKIHPQLLTQLRIKLYVSTIYNCQSLLCLVICLSFYILACLLVYVVDFTDKANCIHVLDKF